MLRSITILIITCLLSLPVLAQDDNNKTNPEDRKVDMDSPTFVPMVRVSKVLEGQDSIPYIEMNSVYVFGPLEFKSDKQRAAYNRLVYNVKKVLPIAKEVNKKVLETYDYLQTLPDDKARKAYMKTVEKQLVAEYKPRMKKLTYSQGKLLIKLVYRETSASSYDLVKLYFGKTRAAFYQVFAWTFGASLKKTYDPNGIDRLTERVVRLVESGQM